MLCEGTQEKKKKKKSPAYPTPINEFVVATQGCRFMFVKVHLSITATVICTICSNRGRKECDTECSSPRILRASGSAMSGGHGENICCLPNPWADIEDEERQYFKANVVPEERLPEPIWLRVLTGLLWTAHTHRFTHSNRQCHSLCPELCEQKDSRFLNSLDKSASSGETAKPSSESTQRHIPVFPQLFIRIHGNPGISHSSNTIFDPFTQRCAL